MKRNGQAAVGGVLWTVAAAVVLFMTRQVAWAEDGGEAKPPSTIEVSGFVDGYYSYKGNEGPDFYRSFDGMHNSFSLSLVEIALARAASSTDPLGFRIDLDYGSAADTFGALDSDQGSGIGLNQAYGSYMRGKFRLDFGKFVTPVGAEAIDSRVNWNYSRSLLFSLAVPYYHVGARATCGLSDKVGLEGLLVNGWNNAVDNNSGKSAGLGLTLRPGKGLRLAQHLLVGPEKSGSNRDARLLLDTVATLDVGSRVGLMGNLDYGREGDSRWFGVAVYGRVNLSRRWAVASRAEWLDDSDGFMTGSRQKLKEITLTIESKVAAGLVTRLELRRDFSDLAVFKNADGKALKGQGGVTLGAVYAFGGSLR